MRLVVCVKHVPHTVKFDCVSNAILRDHVESTMNPFDLYAVEEAVRIKQKYTAEVIAVCMGVSSATQSLKQAIAMGVDSAILLNDSVFAGSDTYATSYIISKAIKKVDEFDLIICGKQSSDSDTAQVGVEIAEKLRLPFITNVVKIDFLDNKRVRCVRLLESGYITLEIPLPALITVSKGINQPRIPTINNYLRAQKSESRVWNAKDIRASVKRCGLCGSPTRVKHTYIPGIIARESQTVKGAHSEQTKFLIELATPILKWSIT